MSASAALRLDEPSFEPCPVEIVPGPVESGILILCDHASNAVPPDLGDLGLPEAEFERHIAYDIGAAEADMGQGFQGGWIERRRKSLTLPLQP